MSAEESQRVIRFSGLTPDEYSMVKQLSGPLGSDYLHKSSAIPLFAEISRLRNEVATLRSRLVDEPQPTNSGSKLSPNPQDRLVVDEFCARTFENTRIRNLCSYLAVKTLGELCCYSREELLSRRNFGKRCIARTEEVLARYGLSLRNA